MAVRQNPHRVMGIAALHPSYGCGNVVKLDGGRLTIAFEKAGEKKVVDSFVERV
jgi:hypothetical protein